MLKQGLYEQIINRMIDDELKKAREQKAKGLAIALV